MSKSFTFKQFHIDIGLCGMPVSTDGVLLGAWADIRACSQILDIGAGTGLLFHPRDDRLPWGCRKSWSRKGKSHGC